MKKSDTTYILSGIFMASTSLFYCCTVRFAIKLPRYYPLQHTWKWINEKGVPSQAWYGAQAFAFLAAGIVTAIAYVVIRRLSSSETSLKPAQIRIFGVVVSLIVAVCLGYILHHEFSRWGVFTAMGLS
jgi:phosphoglycerol transferase MdoB-like AlkP superfamily enzyme